MKSASIGTSVLDWRHRGLEGLGGRQTGMSGGNMATISTADFKNGMGIIYNNRMCTIIEFQHVKPGKGGAFVRMKPARPAQRPRAFRYRERRHQIRIHPFGTEQHDLSVQRRHRFLLHGPRYLRADQPARRTGGRSRSVAQGKRYRHDGIRRWRTSRLRTADVR